MSADRFECFKNRGRTDRRQRDDRNDEAVRLRKDKRGAQVKQKRHIGVPPPPPPSAEEPLFDWGLDVPATLEEQVATMRRMAALSPTREDVWLLAQSGWLAVICEATAHGHREAIILLYMATMFNPETDELVINAGLPRALAAALRIPELQSDAALILGNVALMGPYEIAVALLGDDPDGAIRHIAGLAYTARSLNAFRNHVHTVTTLCRKFSDARYIPSLEVHHEATHLLSKRLDKQFEQFRPEELDSIGGEILIAVTRYIKRRDRAADVDGRALSTEQVYELVALAQPAFKSLRDERLIESKAIYYRAVDMLCAIARVTSPPLAFEITEPMMDPVARRLHAPVAARVLRDGGCGSLADYLVLCENVMGPIELTLEAPTLTYVDQYMVAIGAIGFLGNTSIEMFESFVASGTIQRVADHGASPYSAVVDEVTDVFVDFETNAWFTDAHLRFLATECSLVDLLCTGITNYGSLKRLERLCGCMLSLRERLPDVFEQAHCYSGWIGVVDAQAFESDGSNVRLLADLLAEDDDDDGDALDYREAGAAAAAAAPFAF